MASSRDYPSTPQPDRNEGVAGANTGTIFGARLLSMAAIIETSSLTKRYGTDRGVEDLDLAVHEGEIFGFLGPNGAGKTTTIRTLLDLLHPTSGTARIFGLDSQADSRAIRARVGNLPGEFSYEERLTGEQILSLFGRMRGVEASSSTAALAERFQADLTRPLRELSRGNRQKVGLVQALFHDPELLILDEPTGGLDPLMQEEFLKVIAEHRDRGATVFLSSHDLAEVERVCDRVGIIRAGRLVAVESVEEMRARAYRQVTVTFKEPPSRDRLTRLKGVENVEIDGITARFKATSRIDEVLKEIVRHEILDIEITRPTLEELFLTYYDGSASQ
jgi:ABC-2 type transport system ATP-binding protein